MAAVVDRDAMTFFEAVELVDRDKLTGAIHFLHGKPKLVQYANVRVRIIT